MPTDLDSLEALEDVDFSEFEEALRPVVRTPSARSSFQPRTPPSAASQGQVQAAARNLDAKIETLSAAVKALETRVVGISGKTDKTAAGLAREMVQRRKSEDAMRADLQQSKVLSVLLPLITQKTVSATFDDGNKVDVVTRSSDGLSSILPLLLLLPGTSGGTGQDKGLLGGDTVSTLVLFKVLFEK